MILQNNMIFSCGLSNIYSAAEHCAAAAAAVKRRLWPSWRHLLTSSYEPALNTALTIVYKYVHFYMKNLSGAI